MATVRHPEAGLPCDALGSGGVSVNVVVALVGDERVFDTGFDADAVYHEPYAARRKVELRVSDTETLIPRA
jgi:hypothetical protein